MGKFDVQSLLKIMQGDGVTTLSQATKSDEDKVNSVLVNALPVLVGKMSDNASTKEGAASLNKALNEHKTGDTIDVASFLKNADSEDGEKILSHILGSDKDAATKALSKKSGLSSKKVSSILSLVAPLLLSQLGNNKKDDDESALGGILGSMLGGSSSNNGSLGSTLLGNLLGGSSSSGLGGTLLGNLFGGKEEEKEEKKDDSLLGGLLGGLFGGKEEEKEEKKDDSSLLGGLGSLAMNLFGDSDALKEDEKKKTGKKTAAKKTGTTAKKTAAKKTGTTAKKTGTSTAKKTAAKKTATKKTATKKTATKKTTK